MSLNNGRTFYEKLINAGISCSEIYLHPNIPEKKIRNAIKSYGHGIEPGDVIALLDDTVFGSATDGMLFTEQYMCFHEIMTDSFRIDYLSVNSIEINGKTIIINDQIRYQPAIPNKDKLLILYNTIKTHIFDIKNFVSAEEHLGTDNSIQIEKTEANEEDESCVYDDTKGIECEKTSEDINNLDTPEDIAGNTVRSGKFFALIAKLDGYSIIIVSFLRNDAPDRVFSIIERLPAIGFVGMAGRIFLVPALKWLNDQIMTHGEAYIMNNLVINFKDRNLSREVLAKKIEDAPSSIISDDIKSDAINLLNTYYSDGQIDFNDLNYEIDEQKYMENVGDEKICSSCGHKNNNNAKFCCNCGTKMNTEYVCKKCGYKQVSPMKFCPECGDKII